MQRVEKYCDGFPNEAHPRTQMHINPNVGRSDPAILPYTIRCPVCRRWWDISKNNAMFLGYKIFRRYGDRLIKGVVYDDL